MEREEGREEWMKETEKGNDISLAVYLHHGLGACERDVTVRMEKGIHNYFGVLVVTSALTHTKETTAPSHHHSCAHLNVLF